MSVKRLAIISTHPIQYHAPFFRSLAAHADIDLKVMFCHRASGQEQSAAGFGVEFEWDTPLLAGYDHQFLKNAASNPTVAAFSGLDTPEVFEIIRHEQYDAVMVHGWNYKSAWQAMRACSLTNTPVMARSDSHLHTQRSMLKRSTKWPLYRWFISRLDACLPVGKWSRDYFLHYGAAPDKVYVVPHAVDTDYFSRESARLLPLRPELRSAWRLGPDSTVFLFAGKFIEKKRPMDFVRAIALASKTSRVAGLMVGDGPLRLECEAMVREHNLPISFAGFLNQSEIARAYVAAEAMVLPSNGGETWGIVANEAMACGRPCFVSDRVGCGPDLIASQGTGEIFALGDIPQLAQLITRYGNDRISLAAMGRKAQATSQRHSVSTAVQSMVDAVGRTTSRQQ